MRFCLWLFAGLVCLSSAVVAETLRIGFGSDKPPYIYEEERRGLEFDIVVEASRRAGFAVQPFFAPMERLHHMQSKGELDAIVTTNPNSGLKAFYSLPYIEYRNVAAALASRRLKIEKISDLEKYSVSAFQRARKLLGPEFEAMAEKNPNYREEAQQIARNRLLFGKRVDVIVGDRRIIEYFSGKVGDRVDVKQPLIWYELFPPTPYHVAFRSDVVRQRFDRGLEALQKSGEYAAIEQRYRSPGQ